MSASTHTVRLQVRTLDQAMTLAGIRSDYALAKLMNVHRSTVKRVREGDLQPGPIFIGSLLAALAPLDFGDLFEVVPCESGNAA
ncbi:transcriptional regulator [Actinosynnema sp. CS-041913]|uniref:transcriptional regulator n=1 Tax=Actinosynnema sp. CS-041913 TaxID=3239917 RepID=UPI003D92FD2A